MLAGTCLICGTISKLATDVCSTVMAFLNLALSQLNHDYTTTAGASADPLSPENAN